MFACPLYSRHAIRTHCPAPSLSEGHLGQPQVSHLQEDPQAWDLSWAKESLGVVQDQGPKAHEILWRPLHP